MGHFKVPFEKVRHSSQVTPHSCRNVVLSRHWGSFHSEAELSREGLGGDHCKAVVNAVVQVHGFRFCASQDVLSGWIMNC